MTSIQITDVKQFMKYILLSKMFDEFYVYKLDISSFCNFSINGSLNNDFYTIEEKESIDGRKNALWTEVKPFVLQIIKGSKTPLVMNIILMPDNKMLSDIISRCSGRVKEEDITGLFMNIKFNNKELSIITGTSRKSFTTDKTLDEVWDEEIKQFIKKHEIT